MPPHLRPRPCPGLARDISGCLCALKQNISHRTFHTSRRLRSSPADPEAIAASFRAKFAAGQTFVSSQLLDANQLRLFSLMLDRPHLWPAGGSERSLDLQAAAPKDGTPLPPGYHLAYFTPAQLPGVLGLDGTDTSFNPEPPFTRRMWAGGSVHWPGGVEKVLRVGDVATETTRVLSCEAKVIRRTGESMLVVGVEKEFRDSKGDVCVVDQRNWVFRRALDPSVPAVIPAKPPLRSEAEIEEMGKGEGVVTRRYKRDVVQLFRFSALTFNGHRIHYDRDWARGVEGHRDVVVHGPMNLLGMLDLWRDESVMIGKGVVLPRQIEYRATSPVYAGEGYRMHMQYKRAEGEGGDAGVVVVSDDGTTCMKASIRG